ncbi:MAG TPA: rRNA adenine N-6-methyltransferase family protein [Terriglobales bacterium]|jgi:phospholipid N-methyltransferase|nr:rRNA adenine N-6-methyltransferase family protein [Terriglobales bacterium]
MGTSRNGGSRSLGSHLLLFAMNFFKHPTMLGSVIPSSRFLVKAVLSQVNWERARVIVEYGPGVGTMTQQILQSMREDAILVAIELNTQFVEFLDKKITDPRLRVIHSSATDVREVLAALGLDRADYVISGIPYSTMADSMRDEILKETRELLDPEGALLVYQFTRTVLPYLRSNFTSVEQDFQPLNILPARIFCCTP